jgi:methylphosphotriester-DNA--protein-cysteine methyltransferase
MLEIRSRSSEDHWNLIARIGKTAHTDFVTLKHMSNQSFQTRWQAIQTRDSSMDNTFVYAVRTTKIYCQPSCPSRRPNLENVAFFDTPEQAEAAGFRRCKRCWVRAEKDVTAKIVQKVIDLLENEVDEPSLEALGAAVNLSSWHLQRMFKKAVGISPKQYAKTHRAKKFRSELKSNVSVTRAIYEAGFGTGRVAKVNASLTCKWIHPLVECYSQRRLEDWLPCDSATIRKASQN